jgi:hypothetical protein
MKRVLITAINTQFDRQLVEHLISEKYIVRIIADNIHAGHPLLKLPVEIYPGNLSEKTSIIKSARGCDYIIQTNAGVTGNNCAQSDEILTRQAGYVIEAAKLAGVTAVFHTASLSATYSKYLLTNVTAKNVFQKEFILSYKVLPKVQRLLLELPGQGMRVVLVELDMAVMHSIRNENVSDSKHAASLITEVLRNGKHGNTYVIGALAAPVSAPLRNFKTDSVNVINNPKRLPVAMCRNIWQNVQQWAKLMWLTTFFSI